MANLEVLYNSECPICDREINHYKKISKDKIVFIPISPETLNAWGLSEDQAAKKLHAQFKKIFEWIQSVALNHSISHT